jgi:hypothetical protein
MKQNSKFYKILIKIMCVLNIHHSYGIWNSYTQTINNRTYQIKTCKQCGKIKSEDIHLKRWG